MNGSSEDDLVCGIYDGVPILFYPTYKDMFLIHFEAYCKHHSTNIANNPINKDTLILELEHAGLSIPLIPIFSDFKMSFLKFEHILKKTLQYKNKKNPKYTIVLKNLKKLAENIWITFAYGVRIMKHVPFYQGCVPDWEHEFSLKIKTLNESMLTAIGIVEKNLEIQINSDYTQDKSPEDMIFRAKLAKSIGMDDLPEYDPHAFDRITGIAATQINDTEFDSVEAVRDIRND